MDSPNDNKPTQTIIVKEGSTVKNVIQAIIHLPAWAWITGVVILSISLLLVSTVFNIGSLQGLLPTPTAFAPAIEGQSLIIVADFEDRSVGKYEGIDPAQYVYEQLATQVKKDNLNVRVERLHQIVDDNTSKSTGKTYNATLVVWGWYDALTITPRITRTKTLQGTVSNQENRRLSLVDPEKVEFSIVTDLPSQANYLVMFTLGIDKYVNQNYEEALAYFYNAIEIVSTNTNSLIDPSEVFFFRAFIYYEQKEYSNAISEYNMVIELRPSSFEAYNNRGMVFVAKGEYEQALSDFNQSINLNSGIPESFSNRGVVFNTQGNSSDAIINYTQAIQIDPKFPTAYYNRASAYFDLGNSELAIADLTQAIQINPDYAEAYYNRGTIYFHELNTESAIADFTKAIQLRPDYAEAYFNRGLVDIINGDAKQTIDDFTQYLGLKPDDAIAYNLRGSAYYSQLDFDRALEDYNKAIELKPSYSDAYYNRGFLLFVKGNYTLAIGDFTVCIFLDPKNAKAYYIRGIAYEDQDRLLDAIEDFQHTIELTTDPELRQQAEDELKKLKGQ